MSSKCSGFFSIPMILLLVLIYFFRVELYYAGVHAATLISPNPEWDKKLGEYYNEASIKNAALSKQYYESASKHQKDAVVKEQTKEEHTAPAPKEEHNSKQP
jgi:hypothetical protein